MALSFIQRVSQQDRYLLFRIPAGHALEQLDCAAFDHLNHGDYSAEIPPHLADRISSQGLRLSNGRQYALPRGGRGSRAAQRLQQGVQTRTCVICKQDVRNKDLTRHEEAHYMKRQCRVCGKMIPRLDHFKDHFKPTNGPENAGQTCLGSYRDNCLIIIHSSDWAALSNGTFKGTHIVDQHRALLGVEQMDMRSHRWVKIINDCTGVDSRARNETAQGLVGASQTAPQHSVNANQSPYDQYSASPNNMQRLMMGIPPNHSAIDPRFLTEPFAYRDPAPPVDLTSTATSSHHHPVPAPSTNNGGHQMARLASSQTSENVHAMAQFGFMDPQPDDFEAFPSGSPQFAEDQTRGMGGLGQSNPASGGPQRDLENLSAVSQLETSLVLPTKAPHPFQYPHNGTEFDWT